MLNIKNDDDAQARKEFTSKIFAWLNQVKADGDAGALMVAFEIGQYLNPEHDGAWPSTKTIAGNIRKSQPYVVKMVARLKERGHLRVEPGLPGRGHSNRYWMIIKKDNLGDASYPRKHNRGDASENAKASSSEAESITNRGKKHHPGDMNHYRNHTKNHRGGLQPPPCRDERVTEKVTDTNISFQQLLLRYPADRVGDERAALAAFELALDAGLTDDHLMDELESDLEWNPPDEAPGLADWLNHLMTDAATTIAAEPEPVGDEEQCPF